MIEYILPFLTAITALIGIVKSYFGLNPTLRGVFQIVIEDTHQTFYIHLFNRTERDIRLFGAFLSFTDVLRLPIYGIDQIKGYSETIIEVSKSDIHGFIESLADETDVSMDDTYHHSKLIVDTTEGAFYSDWICFLDQEGIIRHIKGVRHIRSEYVLRHKIDKRQFEFLAILMIMVEMFVSAYILDVDIGYFILCLFMLFLVNMLLCCYYVGYGLSRKWYCYILSFLVCFPSFAALFIMANLLFFIITSIIYFVLVYFLIKGASGWFINHSPQSMYYQYDPYEIDRKLR